MSAALDLVQLRSFVAIADHGGFGRAAHALHLSQPAVSQHVRGLERRLRCALVERSGRGTRFTAAGERLLAEARHILAVHDEALARLERPTAPPVTLGVAASLSEGLPMLLGRLWDTFADGGLRVRVDRSSHVRAAFERGELDAVLYATDGCGRPGRRVASLPLQWVARADLRLDGGALPFVGYTPPCNLRTRAAALLAAEGIELRVDVESQSLDGVVAAVRAGLGATLLTVPERVPAGLVVRTDLPAPGTADVRLAVRAGLEVDTEAALLGVLEQVVPSATTIGTDHGSSLDRPFAVAVAS